MRNPTLAPQLEKIPQETPHAARGVSDGPQVAAMAELAPARVRVLLVRARVRIDPEDKFRVTNGLETMYLAAVKWLATERQS